MFFAKHQSILVPSGLFTFSQILIRDSYPTHLKVPDEPVILLLFNNLNKAVFQENSLVSRKHFKFLTKFTNHISS